MKIFESGSIRRRFTLGLAFVITAIMLTFSVALIIYNSRSIEKELRNNLDRLSTFSKESLTTALWQFNYEYVKDYIESLFLYEDLVFASVESNEMQIGKKAHPDYQGEPFSRFRGSSRFIVAETTIKYKQLNIGIVRLVISRERVSNLVMTTSALAILILLLVNLAIFGTNYLLSSWYLFKPLSKLKSTIDLIATGDLDALIDASSKDEIGKLARSFRQMMDNLKHITTSRDAFNREVEERNKAEMELKGSLKEKEILLKLKYCSKKKYHQLEVTNGGVLQELAPVKAYKISV